MDHPFDRRDFLKTAAGTLALLLSPRGLAASQAAPAAAVPGPAVRFGVIGLGAWGREILDALGRAEMAQAAGICDSYEPFLKRAAAGAPRAEAIADWRRLLDSPAIDAVIVANAHAHAPRDRPRGA